MEKIVVSRDDFIIREGDEGDKLYIVDNGQFQVTKKDAHGVDEVGSRAASDKHL
jgi:CRP-like cAMP-binding protein